MAGRMVLEEQDGGTRMTVVTTFTDVEQMQKMLSMGMQEGMAAAIGQIDALLVPVPA